MALNATILLDIAFESSVENSVFHLANLAYTQLDVCLILATFDQCAWKWMELSKYFSALILLDKSKLTHWNRICWWKLHWCPLKQLWYFDITVHKWMKRTANSEISMEGWFLWLCPTKERKWIADCAFVAIEWKNKFFGIYFATNEGSNIWNLPYKLP